MARLYGSQLSPVDEDRRDRWACSEGLRLISISYEARPTKTSYLN